MLKSAPFPELRLLRDLTTAYVGRVRVNNQLLLLPVRSPHAEMVVSIDRGQLARCVDPADPELSRVVWPTWTAGDSIDTLTRQKQREMNVFGRVSACAFHQRTESQSAASKCITIQVLYDNTVLGFV